MFSHDCFLAMYQADPDSTTMSSGFVLRENNTMKEIIRFEPDLINIRGIRNYEAIDVAVISRWKLAVVFFERPDQIWFLDLNAIKKTPDPDCPNKFLQHLKFTNLS